MSVKVEEVLEEAEARYERMCALVESDPSAGSHACAISYSLDVPRLIGEVKRLRTANAGLLAVARHIQSWMLCDEPVGGGAFIGPLSAAMAEAEGGAV